MVTDEKAKTGIRRALGKGLESLLPSVPMGGAGAAKPGEGEVRTTPGSEATAVANGTGPAAGAKADPAVAAVHLPVGLIDRNPYQTRLGVDEDRIKELAASITQIGVMTPIVVRPVQGGRYVIIAGERRWMASKLAGRETIPAVVQALGDAEAIVWTVTENLQRQDLNPMEQARAFDRMSREFHFEHSDIAAKVGINRSTVTNYLRVLKLPADVLEQVAAGTLSLGHAKALCTLTGVEGDAAGANEAAKRAEMISAVAFKVIHGGLSVRKTEELVTAVLTGDKKKEEKWVPPVDPNVRDAAEKLQAALGLKVVIEDHKGRGKVVIAYSNLDDFEVLMNSFGPRGIR
jgi:ParB family chromosome partitioning protein